ncbi:MAG: major capsid protein [Proteobacteria bacterium]|nr:major capsid protein [Pseudomonadota bacterium]
MPDQLIINPFDTGGYNMATLTESVNLIPNMYGRVRQLGIFTPDPVRTRQIIIEEINGILTLLKSQPVGGPPPRKKHGKAKMRSFIIPHIPYEDQIKAEDIQGGRQPGTTDPKTLEVVMMNRLMEMRAAHAITEEFLMVGGIKGIILDADGTTLENLYTAFGITAKTVDFALDTDSTEVLDKCREIVRHIEDNLLGDVMSGVRCLCGESFFDALVSHPNVEKFYAGHVAFLQNAGIGTDPRKGFTFGGIVFEEYRGIATDPIAGTGRRFIAADDARFFPVGTMNTFKIHYAPANYLETVNTMGLAIYAKQTMEPKGRWVDINTESNPLPMCRRPGILVQGLI